MQGWSIHRIISSADAKRRSRFCSEISASGKPFSRRQPGVVRRRGHIPRPFKVLEARPEFRARHLRPNRRDQVRAVALAAEFPRQLAAGPERLRARGAAPDRAPSPSAAPRWRRSDRTVRESRCRECPSGRTTGFRPRAFRRRGSFPRRRRRPAHARSGQARASRWVSAPSPQPRSRTASSPRKRQPADQVAAPIRAGAAPLSHTFRRRIQTPYFASRRARCFA